MRNRNVIIVISAAVLAVLLFSGLGTMGFGQNGMMGGYGNMGFGSGPFAMGMPLFFGVVMVGGAVLLIAAIGQNANHNRTAAAVGESPLDILKLRFAKGEITGEQFNEMKVHLGA